MSLWTRVSRSSSYISTSNFGEGEIVEEDAKTDENFELVDEDHDTEDEKANCNAVLRIRFVFFVTEVGMEEEEVVSLEEEVVAVSSTELIEVEDCLFIKKKK